HGRRCARRHRARADRASRARTATGRNPLFYRPERGLRLRGKPARPLWMRAPLGGGRWLGHAPRASCDDDREAHPRGAIGPGQARGLPHRSGWNSMSFNTFGHLFRVTTFGESHGVAIGCEVDGCPARIALTEADIQPYLDKRRPGQSRFTTQRREPDQVKILSGVFIDEATGEQATTGTPIALVIDNVDPRSKDYSDIKDKYRPGHADYTYDAKYGIRDHRGGGRQSARETAMRVAAGAIARKIVPGMTVRGALVQMGKHRIEPARWNWDEVERNPFFCPDAEQAKFFEAYLDDIRKRGSSVGAVIEIVAEGVPVGLGAPIYGKLDGDLAAALMGINAVKGVEIGA